MDMQWRSPLRERWNGVYADWLLALEFGNAEAVYMIRDASTKGVLFESRPTKRAFREIDRHMLGWCCDGAGYFRPDRVEVALVACAALRKEAA